MLSSLLRKSITDLSRRRSRTFFAVATLALAVASIGLFATPALMNRAMSAEVAADRLPDLTISTRPLVLDQAQLAALAAVPDVRAVEPRSSFGGRVYVGARRGSKRERFERARRNLALVGLGDKADHLPAELSGGEQQRVAIARALAADPQLIVGDEPTGNLDTVTAAEMFGLFKRLNEQGKTVLYVTHDRELAARAHRVVSIRDGLVVAA